MVLVLFIFLLMSCKSNLPVEKSELVLLKPDKKFGIVSHKFHKKLCQTVVVVESDSNKLIIAPIEKLDSKFDVDGLEISFNYKLSKRSKSIDCPEGLPAFLTDIEKK